MTKQRILAAIIAAAVAVLLWSTFMLWGTQHRQEVMSSPIPSVTEVAVTPSVSSAPPPPSSTMPSATPSPAATPTIRTTTTKQAKPATSCVDTATDTFVPTSFRAYRLHKRVPVMSVGLQDGAAGAPPKNQPYKVAWFTGSPKPGTGKGNVVLTTHTYSKGQALGNDLYGARALRKTSEGTKPGDVWGLSNGQVTACYEVTKVAKVRVVDYKPGSDLIYDFAGPEELAMVICWDKNHGYWDSRVVFTAKRVRG